MKMYTLHYVSQDLPGGDSPWSVYREQYPYRLAEEPIDGTQEWVSRHPSEMEAEVEASRLQKGVDTNTSL